MGPFLPVRLLRQQIGISGQSEAIVVTDTKTRAWEEFGEIIENNLQVGSKRFWTIIRHLQKEKQCTIEWGYKRIQLAGLSLPVGGPWENSGHAGGACQYPT